MSRRRILIVGGVAAGASCAARARRLDESAEIVVFEKGPHVSFANCGLPYHVGDVIRDESALLLVTPERFKQRVSTTTSTKAGRGGRTPGAKGRNPSLSLLARRLLAWGG